MTKPDHGREVMSMARRRVDAAFGAFFVAIAITILVVSGWPIALGAVVAASIVGFLGLDAIVGAVRGRRSLLSRIGPLP